MRFAVLLAALLIACGSPPVDSDSGADVATVDAVDAGADLVSTDALEAGTQDVTDAAPADTHRDCVDADGDGYGTGADCMGPDCNDGDATVHPGAPERCDGVDSNCDGLHDAADLDAYCRGTCGGACADAIPPACVSAARSMLDAHYVRTSVPHCQSCRVNAAEPSGYSCECWGADRSETWRCDSRP